MLSVVLVFQLLLLLANSQKLTCSCNSSTSNPSLFNVYYTWSDLVTQSFGVYPTGNYNCRLQKNTLFCTDECDIAYQQTDGDYQGSGVVTNLGLIQGTSYYCVMWKQYPPYYRDSCKYAEISPVTFKCVVTKPESHVGGNKEFENHYKIPVGVIVGVSVGSFVLIAFVGIFIWYRRRNQIRNTVDYVPVPLSEISENSISSTPVQDLSPVYIATNGHSKLPY